MKLGIRAKLFVVSVGVILVSFFVAWAVLRTQLTQLFTQKVGDDLAVRADLVALRAGEVAAPLEPSEAWNSLASALSRPGRCRVTLIRNDGVVLADSGTPFAQLGRLENHSDRPEIQQALETGRGHSARHSPTLDLRMYYAAVPFRRAGAAVGVARVAVPLTEVDQAMSRLRNVLTGGTALALLVAVLMSSLAAHLLSRTAVSLAGAAQRMAEGDLATRVRPTSEDEFGQLGRSLDRMAQTLSAAFDRLREERDRLGGILSGMREGVLVLDREGRVALVNPALRELLLLGTDAVGKRSADAIAHPSLERLLVEARSSGGIVSEEVELGGLKPRVVMARSGPLAGEPGGVFCVVVDVTDIRRLESLRRDFVSNVSHELRTPVTAIRSAAETLQNAIENDPAAVSTFVQIIDRNAARLHALVEDLLDLSRIESKQLKLDLRELKLDEVFAQVIDLFRERADKKQLRLECDVPEGLPAALTDRDALDHVLTNLVDNAVKYCGPGATVTLRAVEVASGLRVSVADTGPGIDAAHLPRLFERFYRVDTGRSRELGGTGLGLSIVKHLVEGLGGTVWVESEPGRGTVFGFMLKRAGDAVAAPPLSSRPHGAIGD